MHFSVANRFLSCFSLSFSGLKSFVLAIVLVLSITPYYAIGQTSVPVESNGIVSIPDTPVPHRFVNDYANVLTESEEKILEEQLEEIDKGTTVQIAVVTLNTTKDVPLTDYAHQLFQKWGIGQKGKDNGLLLTVAISDRKSEITVGYGLEGVVTDADARYILHNVLRPFFKEGKYYSGLMASTDSLYKLTLGLYKFTTYGAPEIEEEKRSLFLLIIDFAIEHQSIFIILFIIIGLSFLTLILFLNEFIKESYLGIEAYIAQKIGGSYLENHKVKLIKRKERAEQRELERKNENHTDSRTTTWADFRNRSGSFGGSSSYSGGSSYSGSSFGGGRSGGGGASGSW